jgi:hypothetical protein
VVVQPPATTIITIEPINPQVVYVPTYNPAVVYGGWPYPAYPPPAPYYPPGYVAGTALLSFGVGMAVGASLWGNCNWNSGHADVNINQYNNYTRNVNTSTTANQRIQSAGSTGQGGRQVEWKHNAERRGAVPYRKARISDSSRPTKRRRRSCKLPGRMTPQRWFGSWGRTASASFRPVTPSATGEHENGSSSCTTRPAGSSPSQRPKPSSIWARTTGRCPFLS